MNSFSELHIFNISSIIFGKIGAISSFIKIDKSAKYVKAVSRSSSFESASWFKQDKPNYVNISIAYEGKDSFPQADANRPTHIKAYPFTYYRYELSPL